MKRPVLCLAMLLSLSASQSGCSWIFVQPLPPRYERADRTDCTTNRAAPVLDTIFTLTNVASAVYVAGQDNIANKGPAVTVGLLVGALWFSSAIYGYSKTSECEVALADDEPAHYSHPHMRLRSTPAVGYPAGVPGQPPPPMDSPAVVVPSPPPPAPAALGSQQRDDDDPGARARSVPAAPQQADPE